MTLVLRRDKGSALTYNEMDDNFVYLDMYIGSAAGSTGFTGSSGDTYSSTSSTSLSLSIGSKTFNTGTGLSYIPGQEVVIAFDQNNLMSGTVSDYNESTGLMSVEVTAVTGSGTYSDWGVNLLGVQGYAGSRGYTGSKGFTGSQGIQGFAGSKGDIGFTGSRGDLGYTGSQGFVGSRGTQGPMGFTGSQGIQGFTGSKGNIGFTGSRGIQGTTGFAGSRGDLGYTGSRGFVGSRGFTGSQGIQGNTGFVGSRGFVGSKGNFEWSRKIANYTALNNDYLIADTTSGTFTISLPPTPNLGDYIVISDGGDFSVNNLIVDRNGSTIEGLADNFLLDMSNISTEFVFDGTTWQLYSNLGPIGYTGSKGDTGGLNVTNDISTNATRYIPFTDQVTGNVSDINISSSKLYFNPSTGQLNATEFNSLSDADYKENITDVQDAIKTITKMRGVEFDWKNSNQKSYGVIAQEIEKILPHIVSNGDAKTVNYSGIIPFLIESIKYLNDELNKLKE